MNYSKKFFLAIVSVTVLVAVGLAVLLRDQPVALIVLLVLMTAGAAVMGRVSGMLTDLFSRLCGAVFVSKPVMPVAALVLGRPLKMAPMAQTPEGLREVFYDRFDYSAVKEGLRQMGIPVEPLRIAKEDFSRYLEQAKYEVYYPEYYVNAPQYLVHKQIQHYLSLQRTPVAGKEVWMDAASSSSPFPDILLRLYGIAVYRQDLCYPAGLHGLRIGSDATHIPVPDNFVDRISLHCSFEHFERDSDINFFAELARVLKPGGVACIIPIYVSNEYQILTNPRHWMPRGVPRETGAQITLSRLYWESHGRFYDFAALKRRVLAPLDSARLKYAFYEVEVPSGVEYPPFLMLQVTK